ncbi:CBS domain-containing protein [Peptococcaceae bacterium 1198_IL3148]
MLPPENSTAKDIMLPVDSYPIIYENDTVKRALSKFQFSLCSYQNKRRNLLVLDQEDKPIGWVTLRDILSVIQPISTLKSYIQGWNLADYNGPATYFAREFYNSIDSNYWQKTLTELCENLADKIITDIIRPLESGAVHANTSLHTAATIMSENNISTLPVVEQGKLVGFIRAEDIVLEMAKVVMNVPHTEKGKLTIPSTSS